MNFDDRASWLSAGLQPLARTTSLPFPSPFSITAGSPFSKRARTRASPSAVAGMRRYFQNLIFVKSLNCGPAKGAKRGWSKAISPSITSPVGAAASTSRAGESARAARVVALPGAVTTTSTVPPPSANRRRKATFAGEVSVARTTRGTERPGSTVRGAAGDRASTFTLRRGVSSNTRPR